MSGTSLDGVDLAYCKFDQDSSGKWNFEILRTAGKEYSSELLHKLKKATTISSQELYKLDKELGTFLGEMVDQFCVENNISKEEVDAVASHGQTVFHQPENGFTVQIGCGTNLAVNCGIPVINDFRSKDISLGGQGAPLVPIGDLLLFDQFAEAFLNIGGFCNISFPKKTPLTAFDICPGNLPLNHLMETCFSADFDKNGEKARSGKIDQTLLNRLNAIDFYASDGPKSLGTEWLFNEFMPLLDENIPAENQLATIVEHIASQVADTLKNNSAKSVFVTGGGAKNTFLIERIQSKIEAKIILPSAEIIDFKEAIIFGFLGALYLSNQNNVLSSVTGAKRSSRGGILHTP